MQQEETKELELTYLAAAQLPNLEHCESKKLYDIYYPSGATHPELRIRKKSDRKGESYELTKKTQINPGDASIQKEENVTLSQAEFEALAKGDGLVLFKTRYFFPYGNLMAEIDIFEGSLQGLVTVEFEFPNEKVKKEFIKPDFCLVDVTQEDFIAGGALAGKTFENIIPRLQLFKYQSPSSNDNLNSRVLTRAHHQLSKEKF